MKQKLTSIKSQGISKVLGVIRMSEKHKLIVWQSLLSHLSLDQSGGLSNTDIPNSQQRLWLKRKMRKSKCVLIVSRIICLVKLPDHTLL